METDKLIQQIETYSNAIIAFAVLQSLGYAYAFGSNETFNCYVKTATLLAAGLCLMFLVVTVLLVAVMHYFRKTVRELAGEHSKTVDKVYLGKMVAVILFSLLPFSLTLSYGLVLDTPKVECNKLLRNSTSACCPCVLLRDGTQK